ncbi:hypothetical protein ACS0TY_035690 [Phlomoides rotata]
MDGVGRSIRVNIQVDITKPIKNGISIANKEGNPVRIPFKYEQLPSFCFFCGMLGHMKRECDLIDGDCELLHIPNVQLPFGEWLKASPTKRASVTSTKKAEKREISPT